MLRSRYGLGRVPRKPADFMPCCTRGHVGKILGQDAEAILRCPPAYIATPSLAPALSGTAYT